MQSQEIEQYLAELGAELQSQGIKKPIRMLLIGGAYMMLLANAPRTTDDIDIFWLEEGAEFQKARLALRDGVQTIASKYTLPANWFNYLTQMLIYDKMIMPRGKLWKRFKPWHGLTNKSVQEKTPGLLLGILRTHGMTMPRASVLP